MSKNHILTHRGDPGVTQSNPRKVALDGPLLNSLKEDPRNALTKGTRPPSLLSRGTYILTASPTPHCSNVPRHQKTTHGMAAPAHHHWGNKGWAAEFLSALFMGVLGTSTGSVPSSLWEGRDLHVWEPPRCSGAPRVQVPLPSSSH